MARQRYIVLSKMDGPIKKFSCDRPGCSSRIQFKFDGAADALGAHDTSRAIYQLSLLREFEERGLITGPMATHVRNQGRAHYKALHADQGFPASLASRRCKKVGPDEEKRDDEQNAPPRVDVEYVVEQVLDELDAKAVQAVRKVGKKSRGFTRYMPIHADHTRTTRRLHAHAHRLHAPALNTLIRLARACRP
jgi:hypothetical protein